MQSDSFTFRVLWECTACGHKFTSTVELDRSPDVPLCPDCGLDWVYAVKSELIDG